MSQLVIPRATLRSAEDRVRRTELIISYTLRLGVVTSVILILLGMCVSFIRHPQYLSSKTELVALTRLGATFPQTIGGVVLGLAEFRGQALVVLGLLVLIATPVVRVAISILAFLLQRDHAFVAITTIVFALLLLSFVLGHAAQ